MKAGSNKGRLLEAFTGTGPAQAPFFEEVMEQLPAEQVLGRSTSGNTRTMEPADYVELSRRLGTDCLVANKGGFLSGGLSAKASDGSEHYVGGSVTTREELLRGQPLFNPAEMQALMASYVQAAEGSGVGVMTWLPGPVTGPAMAIGYEKLGLALYDDPAFVEDACDIQTERTLQLVDAASDAGVDFLGLGDDISDSTGPMMSPQLLRRFWVPRVQAVVTRARQKGLPIMLHCCGHLGAVLPLAIEVGFDAIQPVAACNDVDAILLAAQGRITVVGTIDVGSVLVRGTPQLVTETVFAHWCRYGAGRFVLGSNHSINEAVPPENVRAMTQAVSDLRNAGLK